MNNLESKDCIRLDKYCQQIILACKGWNSKEYSIRYTIERIISQLVAIDINIINHDIVYYWLLKLCKQLDPRSVDRVFENLFRYNDSTSAYNVIGKLIGILANLRVEEDGHVLLELEYDEKIMNGVCRSE